MVFSGTKSVRHGFVDVAKRVRHELRMRQSVSDMSFMVFMGRTQMSKNPWNEVENFVFMIVRSTGSGK